MSEYTCRIVYLDENDKKHTAFIEAIYPRRDGGFLIFTPGNIMEKSIHLQEILLIKEDGTVAGSYPAPLTDEELDRHQEILKGKR